jgi:hypothetical protein
VVLTIGHTLRPQEALGCSDALPGFLEVDHRFFEDGVFVGHEKSIRVGIIRSLDYCVFTCELPYQRLPTPSLIPFGGRAISSAKEWSLK